MGRQGGSARSAMQARLECSVRESLDEVTRRLDADRDLSADHGTNGHSSYVRVLAPSLGGKCIPVLVHRDVQLELLELDLQAEAKGHPAVFATAFAADARGVLYDRHGAPSGIQELVLTPVGVTILGLAYEISLIGGDRIKVDPGGTQVVFPKDPFRDLTLQGYALAQYFRETDHPITFYLSPAAQKSLLEQHHASSREAPLLDPFTLQDGYLELTEEGREWIEEVYISRHVQRGGRFAVVVEAFAPDRKKVEPDRTTFLEANVFDVPPINVEQVFGDPDRLIKGDQLVPLEVRDATALYPSQRVFGMSPPYKN